MIYKPFFLMAVLVFGLIGNPFAFSNFDNKIDSSGVEFDFISSNGFVFAQTTVTLTNLRITDESGRMLSNVFVDQFVQITADIINNQAYDQPFAFIVNIKDRNGETIYESWNTGNLEPQQTLSPALSWTPTNSGTYTIIASVKENVDSRDELDRPLSMKVQVFDKEEQEEMEERMKEQMKEFDERMKEQQKEMEERMKEKQKEMEETMKENMKELEKMFGKMRMGDIPETLDEIREGPFDEEFTINAKTDGEKTYVKIELKFSTDSTDQEQILEETIDKLTVTKEEADAILEIEQVSSEELEEFADSDKRFSGNLHIDNNFANVHLRLEFVTDSTERDAILDDIVSMTEETATMMQESFRMRPFVPRMEDFEGDFNERMKKMEDLAFQRAQEIIAKMQERIDELEQRMQRLVEKLETGQYYGPNPASFDPESFESKSYSLSFEGSAEDVSDSSNVQESSGEIFLETLVEGNRIAKLKVTGGTVVVGETFYDFAFGKARSASSGPSGSMVLIANLNDEEGNFYGLKILLEADAPLEEIELEPVNVEIKSPQSKIAGKYFLSGSGQLALIEG